MILTRCITASCLVLWGGHLAAQDGPTYLSNPFVPLPFSTAPTRNQAPPNQDNRPRPWQNDVLVYRSTADGRSTLLHAFERAGVPTLARLKDGRMIAAFQHFPKDDAQNFDRVAVAFSSDDGKTWSKPAPITIEGMETGLMRAFDPTLVPLPDGRIRLYFTSNRAARFEESTPAIYSAISSDGIQYKFEPGVRFGVEGRVVIDCAVCLHKGLFHLISPDNGTAEDMRREMETRQPPSSSGMGYHAVSKDGLTFERVADVKLNAESRWLGNLLSDGTNMTFIGTGRGLWMATSSDGVAWTPIAAPHVPGADPGLVRFDDGTWFIIATGPPQQRR
jgi:hypothetical protein